MARIEVLQGRQVPLVSRMLSRVGSENGAG